MTNKPIVEALQIVLADSYALYAKTQNYHWNVEGPNFKTLHLLFEEQYTDLVVAIDTIAELIRGLGEKVQGTLETYIKNTSINSGNETLSANQMIKELIEDNNIVQKTLNNALKIAQEASDEVVIGFIIERLTIHRKAIWMLNSSI